MACEWEEYEAKLTALNYDEYDDQRIIISRVGNFSQLYTLNTMVAAGEIGIGVGCILCNVIVLPFYMKKVKEVGRISKGRNETKTSNEGEQ